MKTEEKGLSLTCSDIVNHINNGSFDSREIIFMASSGLKKLEPHQVLFLMREIINHYIGFPANADALHEVSTNLKFLKFYFEKNLAGYERLIDEMKPKLTLVKE